MIRFLLAAFGVFALVFVVVGACVVASAFIDYEMKPAQPWDDDEREYPAGTFSENEK